jgi:NTP pyrophosphatase (non-canonical NTP hydrolase)
MPDFRAAQDRAWKNKQAKGFNTTDVPLEFGLLHEEIAEAFSKWRKMQPGLGEELADVAIFLLGLAEMTGVDLGAEVDAKLTVNEARAYVTLQNGTPVKDGAEAWDDTRQITARCWNCPAEFVVGAGYGEPVESQVFCSEPCAAQYAAELGA